MKTVWVIFSIIAIAAISFGVYWFFIREKSEAKEGIDSNEIDVSTGTDSTGGSIPRPLPDSLEITEVDSKVRF